MYSVIFLLVVMMLNVFGDSAFTEPHVLGQVFDLKEPRMKEGDALFSSFGYLRSFYTHSFCFHGTLKG